MLTIYHFQTFLAIAVPIDIPNKNVFVSYNFESNYSTLTNITEIDEVLFPNLPVSLFPQIIFFFIRVMIPPRAMLRLK